ncbi:MAG: GtrA family protein [Myxococcales bacterium]|nr:GtrA family protein [Myxococcales bacterium]
METLHQLRVRLKPLAGAAIGGLAGTVVDVVILSMLCHRGVAVAYAAFAGAMAGAVLCFVANKYVAFGDRRRPDLRQVAAFGGVALATAVLMAVAMHLACDRAHLPYLTAKVVCAAVIFVCWSYPAQRRLVFAPA